MKVSRRDECQPCESLRSVTRRDLPLSTFCTEFKQSDEHPAIDYTDAPCLAD